MLNMYVMFTRKGVEIWKSGHYVDFQTVTHLKRGFSDAWCRNLDTPSQISCLLDTNLIQSLSFPHISQSLFKLINILLRMQI